MSRYRWISARKAEGFPIRLCLSGRRGGPLELLRLEREPRGRCDTRRVDEAYLVNEIMAIHDTLDDTYGSPRLTSELRRERCVNHKRVEESCATTVSTRKTPDARSAARQFPTSSAPPLPDHINRDFRVGAPGLRTCGDITYIPTGEGWLYLAGVLDIGSRRCLGYDMGERMPTELVSKPSHGSRHARCERQGNGLSR